jgi:ferredoxin
MKVKIDKTRCSGCAICVNICPKGIKMVDEKAEIIDENAGCLKDAADACPQKAIVLNGEDYKNKTDKATNRNYNQYTPIGRGRGMGPGRGRGLGRGPRDGRGGGRGGGGRRRRL